MAFLNTKLVLIALRLMHVVAGVLWVGGAALLSMFVLPAARDETNATYLRRLIWTRNLPLTDGASASSSIGGGEVGHALSRYAAAMRLVTALLLGTAALMAVARYL